MVQKFLSCNFFLVLPLSSACEQTVDSVTNNSISEIHLCWPRPKLKDISKLDQLRSLTNAPTVSVICCRITRMKAGSKSVERQFSCHPVNTKQTELKCLRELSLVIIYYSTVQIFFLPLILLIAVKVFRIFPRIDKGSLVLIFFHHYALLLFWHCGLLWNKMLKFHTSKNRVTKITNFEQIQNKLQVKSSQICLKRSFLVNCLEKLVWCKVL